MILPKVEEQKIEKVSKPKEKEPAENDGWGAWKDPP